MNRYTIPKRLRQLWFATALALTFGPGCVPKEVSLTQSSEDGSVTYAGFDGIKSADTVGGTRVLVKWTPSTSANVVAYNIYDSTFKFNPKLIKTVAAPADQVTLSGLANQTLYSFRVRAADKDNVEDSNTKDVRAIPYAGISSAQVLSSTSARINFNSGSNSDKIYVFCKEGSSTTWNLAATVTDTTKTSVDLTGLAAGTTYTCRAALEIDTFTDNNAVTATFTPMGQAATLMFSSQPSNGQAGQALSTQPVITIKDANGNVVAGGPDSTALITLTIALTSPTGGTLMGTTTATAVNGVATFTGLNMQTTGIKILTATKEDTSAQTFGTAAMSVDSNSFTITAGPVSATTSTLELAASTPNPVANGVDSYTVTFKLKDEFGNPVSGIRPSFVSNTVGDTLTQPAQNTNAQGEVSGTISTTVADYAPTLRRLNISSPAGLSTVSVLAPFIPGPATKLAYAVQPVNSPAGVMGMSQIQVAIQDAQGNRITTGANSTLSVNLSIASNVNGAVLSGTNPKNAASGIATFDDMGIDITANGYRLIASAGSLTPAYSNTFNITAGVPRKISISGASSVVSGVCSTAITIQLQDLGSNPANAIQGTTLTLTGLGSGTLYTSNNCSGGALSGSISFTAGTSTRLVYLKDNKSEGLTISATDSSAVLTAATHGINVSPSRISLLAQAAPPAAPLTPLSVVSGVCSTEIVITPMGYDNNPAPTFAPATVSITGLSSTQAKIYSDSNCSTELDPMAVILPINSGPTYTKKIYLKDPVAHSLNISVSDTAVPGMLTTSTPQSVTVLPSNLDFTGPTSAVAGLCSAVFTILKKDFQGNSTSSVSDKTLTINGISVSSQGKFYTSSNCSDAGSKTTLTFPGGASALQVYYRNPAAEVSNVYISDPVGQMANSQTISITVSPSAFRIVTPVAGNAKTNVCAGPFHVETLDSVGGITSAVSSLTALLSGEGVAGGFYSDSGCTNSITQLSFSSGDNQKNFYFMGYYPDSLTLTATDQAAVLTAGTAAWTVTAAKSWIGTASTDLDSMSNPLWFRTNPKTVAARYDGLYSMHSLRFDPSFRYLYVADADMHRVLKYDYTNHTYVGWVGGFYPYNGKPISGSNLTSPTDANALCVSTTTQKAVPYWCVGGQSWASGNNASGVLYSPYDVADDGTYLYVANYSGHSVSRFNSATGEFDGYIGWITGTSGLTNATGGPTTCATTLAGNVTPGWCKGGTSGSHGVANPINGDGRIRNPRALAFDSDYLYVLNYQMVTRYNKTSGAFAGWIGMVSTTPGPGGAAGCNVTATDNLTPGWCMGGMAKEANAQSFNGQAGGIIAPTDMMIVGDDLYVMHGNGTIVKYDRQNGNRVGSGLLANLTFNWVGSRRIRR